MCVCWGGGGGGSTDKVGMRGTAMGAESCGFGQVFVPKEELSLEVIKQYKVVRASPLPVQ